MEPVFDVAAGDGGRSKTSAGSVSCGIVSAGGVAAVVIRASANSADAAPVDGDGDADGGSTNCCGMW